MMGKMSPRQWVCYTLVCVTLGTLLFQLYQTRPLHPSNRARRDHLATDKQLHEKFQVPTKHLSRAQTASTTQSIPSSISPIGFPHGGAVRADVLNASWVPTLWRTLGHFSSKRLNLVVSDGKFLSILLNWLIGSLVKLQPPLDNVLVIALNDSLQAMLELREIPSVYVDHTTVVAKGTVMQTRHSHIWITRTTVYRLLSYWGYDITVYDSDAVVLQNPTALFDLYKDRDIVGSAGTYPFMLGEKWGQTFCMGVALFRHTPRTELLWKALSNVRNFSLDDQVKLNYALDKCGVRWSPADIRTETVLGECPPEQLGGLRVAVLPHTAVCRRSPCPLLFYILHRNSRKESAAKIKVAKAHRMWFLRDDWMKIDNSSQSARLTATQWLQAISSS